MKSVTSCSTTRCKLKYLLVVPLPPDDNVIKWYMDMILQMANDLELDYIFAHADEAINSKMLIISWLHQEKYKTIISIMGGFHTILVNLKILYKKYGCLGLSNWWVDAEAIAQSSVSQAIEGRHYARSVRLHKQSFEALLRYGIQAENICENLTPSVTQALAEIRKSPCPTNLRMVEFRDICAKLLQHSDGTHAKMMNEYL